MPQVKEIVEKENLREMNSVGTIYLHQEGTFLRAYEMSALLCREYLSELKVSKKKFKDIESPVVYVGFPLTSLEKFTPTGADVEMKGTKSYDIVLPDVMIREELSFEKLKEMLARWKEEIPLMESSPSPKQGSNAVKANAASSQDSPETIMSIVHDVVTFPIEQKSLIQCTEFLMGIRQRFMNTMC